MIDPKAVQEMEARLRSVESRGERTIWLDCADMLHALCEQAERLKQDNAILLTDRKRGDEIYAHICVLLVQAGFASFGRATEALDALIAERDRLRQRVEGLERALRHARNAMAGEGVADQSEAWDVCLRILDAALRQQGESDE